MPVVNHLDLVQSVPPPPSGAALNDLLAFVLQVLAVLPANEKAGLLRKDAGENIIWYAPAGVNVSVSRVCYPDGQLYKVLTDAGIGGANGPAWNDDGTVDSNRWISVATPPPPPPPSDGLDDLKKQVTALGITVKDINGRLWSLTDAVYNLTREVHTLQDLLSRSISTSRSWGHTHNIKLL